MSRTRATRRVPRGPKGASHPAETLAAVEEGIGYAFSDRAMLNRALTHPSAVQPDEVLRHSYQRLEFLGDRVLALVIAERLFERRPDEREGHLAPRLNRLVNKEACAEAARSLGLGPYVHLSAYERGQGGEDRDSTLGDVCEALIGAIYRDGGLKPARGFIERAWKGQFNERAERIKHPKTLLQEWAQGAGLDLPDYRVTARSGPDHAPLFTVQVSLSDGRSAEGTAGSKSDAESAAAFRLLEEVAPADD